MMHPAIQEQLDKIDNTSQEDLAVIVKTLYRTLHEPDEDGYPQEISGADFIMTTIDEMSKQGIDPVDCQ